MSDVKRYAFQIHRRPYGLEEVGSGNLVMHSDYAKLEAEAQALREEVAAANDRADTMVHRMMGMMTRHFAESWRNRDTEKALDGYLSAGIAELERERDCLGSQLTELTAEAAAMEEELEALRARVVVVPERMPRSSDISSIYLHSQGWNACLDELSRLNGKAVSEGLLRAACFGSEQEAAKAMNILRTQLGEGKEHE